jgi:hypothetical protein
MKGAGATDLSRLKGILEEKSDILFREFVPGQWYKLDR